nr:MAG TPA: minor tail protein [Caudoviricetes sp.]
MASETKHIDLIMKLVDGVTRPLAEIRSNMQATANTNVRLGRTVSNIGKSISGVGKALLPVSAGIVGAAVAGGNAFMGFEYAVTAAGTKAGATAAELQKMKQVAADIGRDFPVTATDAAQGMDRLAASGFNASQVIGAMPGIVTAAVASGEDLALTSNVISSALAIWNLKTGDVAANTQRVADVIQMTANQSKMDMQGFGLAMQYAGAPAASLGVTIEELGTAMGIMANNGLEATTIGTSMRSMLSRLASPPKQAAQAISSLGLTVKDASGNFVGMENIINQLRKAMSGMSDVEQVANAKAIAGQEAYSGLLALIRTAPGDYQAMKNAIENSGGSSEAAFKKMEATMKGSIEALKSSIESIAITFGDVLSPKIQSIANSIKSVTDWISKLSPSTKMLIADVAAGVVGFTAFTVVLGKVVQIGGAAISLYGRMGRALNAAHTGTRTSSVIIRGLNSGLIGLRAGIGKTSIALSGFFQTLTGGGAIGALKTIASAVFSPMGIAIIAVVAAIYVLYTRWNQFAPVFLNMWNRIKDAASAAWQAIQPGISRLIATIQRLWEAWQAGTGPMGVIKGLLTGLAEILGTAVVLAIEQTAAVLSGVLVAAFGVVAASVNMAIGIFNGLIEFITGVFTGDWETAWQGVVDIFGSVFHGVASAAESVLGGVRAAVNGIIDAINGISIDVPEWVPIVGGQSWHPSVPHVYTGDSFFAGGPAVINDRYGGEIVNLPHGAQVIPHDQSLVSAYNAEKRSGTKGAPNISINIAHADMSSERSIKDTAKEFAEQLFFELQTREINMNEGAI